MKINMYYKGMNGDNAFMSKEEVYQYNQEMMDQFGPKPAGIAQSFKMATNKKKMKKPKIKASKK